MNEEQLNAIRRRTPDEVYRSVARGPGYASRLMLAIELAMFHEWWHGYYAAVHLRDNLEEAVAELTNDSD